MIDKENIQHNLKTGADSDIIYTRSDFYNIDMSQLHEGSFHS